MSDKGGKAVPYIVLLDSDGKVVAPYKGPHRVEAFDRARGFAERLVALRAVKTPTPAQQLESLVAKVELSLLPPTQARKALESIPTLTKAQRSAANRTISDAQVLRAWYASQPRTKADRIKLGKRYQAMFKDGCRPKRKAAAQAFYMLICEHAEAIGSAAIYRASLEALRAWLVEQGADADRALRPFDARLERLEARKK